MRAAMTVVIASPRLGLSRWGSTRATSLTAHTVCLNEPTCVVYSAGSIRDGRSMLDGASLLLLGLLGGVRGGDQEVRAVGHDDLAAGHLSGAYAVGAGSEIRAEVQL